MVFDGRKGKTLGQKRRGAQRPVTLEVCCLEREPVNEDQGENSYEFLPEMERFLIMYVGFHSTEDSKTFKRASVLHFLVFLLLKVNIGVLKIVEENATPRPYRDES